MATTNYTGNISQQTHSYAIPGKYELKIDDAVTNLAFGYGTTYKDYTKQITKISEFGSNLTALGNYCFYYCNKLSSIDLENSNITNIGTYAFRFSGLRSIYIPKQLTSIGTYAFASISCLNDISVDPANTVFDSRENSHALIRKSTNAFVQASIQTTTIPSTVTSLEAYSFSYLPLTSITIPSNVTTTVTRIGAIFSYCPNLISVEFPNTLNSTSMLGMFRECPNFLSIDMPNCYTTTGTYTFAGDRSLRYVRMSNKLTAVAAYAFADCSYDKLVIDFSERTLTSVPSLVATSFYDREAVTAGPMNTDFKVLVPESMLSKWKTTTNWVTIADHIVSELPADFYTRNTFELTLDNYTADMGTIRLTQVSDTCYKSDFFAWNGSNSYNSTIIGCTYPEQDVLSCVNGQWTYICYYYETDQQIMTDELYQHISMSAVIDTSGLFSGNQVTLNLSNPSETGKIRYIS